MSDNNGLNNGMTLDSEWNEAKAYFYRIHMTLMVCDQCAMMKNYDGQLSALFTVHRELSAQMKPDELGLAEDLYDKASRLVNYKNKNVRQEILVKSLYNYELHLRKVMKDRKMDLPRQKDPGAALTRV